MKNSHRKVLHFGALSSFLFVAFNNCSGEFSTERIDAAFLSGLNFSSFNLSGKCENELYQIFQSTYHPFLINNCSACHDQGGIGAGSFAQQNPAGSFGEFMSKGATRIDNNAVGSHKPPYTGSQHSAAVNSLSASWTSGLNSYNACVAENGSTDDDGLPPIDQGTIPTADTVVTTNKMGPAGLISSAPNVPLTNGAPNYTNYSGWKTIEWDLNLDVVSPSKQHQGKISIQVAPYVMIQNGMQVKRGFIFRNPSANLASANNPHLKMERMFIKLNGQLVTTLTTYGNLSATVMGTTRAPLLQDINYGLLAMENPSDTDQFALQIQSITEITPPSTNPSAPVSYAELMGTNASVNVFRASCVSCHSNTVALGNLNLENFAAAKAKGPQILSRMRNVSAPMPQSGILTEDRTTLVERWVNANYPQ